MLSTATVETLVAEVRVLMVGSRQVTLSVARQLDWCRHLADMEPFGRVNLDERFVVIGRHRLTGALVLAQYDPHFPRVVWIEASDLTGKLTVCRAVLARHAVGSIMLHYNGHELQVARDALQPCDDATHTGWTDADQCPHWRTNDQDANIDAEIDRHAEAMHLHRSMAALPLIVLAGLR
jgi:hypothetical protein